MKVPAVISAAFFIAVVPRASLSQNHGDQNQYAVAWPLLLPSGSGMIYGRPQYGQNFYGGQYNDNGSPNPGWDDVIHWNNGIREHVFYHSGLQPRNQEIPQDSWGGSPLLGRGRARGGGGAHNPLPAYHPRINVMGSYLGSMTIPSVGGGQAKLRQKRDAQYDDEEYERRRRRRRKRPRGPRRGQKGQESPPGQGLVLGKALRCPKAGGGQPLRFNLKVE